MKNISYIIYLLKKYIKIYSFHSLYSLCNNFPLLFILSYSRYARASLYRVLEAREKLDTGALFWVWGNNNFTSIWKRKGYAENRLFL